MKVSATTAHTQGRAQTTTNTLQLWNWYAEPMLKLQPADSGTQQQWESGRWQKVNAFKYLMKYYVLRFIFLPNTAATVGNIMLESNALQPICCSLMHPYWMVPFCWCGLSVFGMMELFFKSIWHLWSTILQYCQIFLSLQMLFFGIYSNYNTKLYYPEWKPCFIGPFLLWISLLCW